MKKMMKMKRTVGILMAVLMMVTMAVPAMAANETPEEGNATITIQNPTLGETYTLYKVFDATVNPDTSVDKDKNIAYRLPVDPDFDGTYDGVTYFVQDSAGNITATEAAYAKNDEGATIKDRLSAGAISWIKRHGTEISKKTEITADDLTGNALVFDKLTYGYYYVSSTLKKDEQSDPAITVTSTNPNAVIIDKNQGPGWTPDPEKPDENIGKMIVVKGEGNSETLVDTNSLNFGDEVEFQISIDATNYNGEKQINNYYVIDKLQTGFTFTGITSVKIVKDHGEETDLTSDYDIKENELEEITIGTGENAKSYKKFTLTIPWADKSGDVWTSKYPANSKIVIRYTATLNDGAVIAEDGNENRAKFVYSYTDTPNPKPEDPQNPLPGVEEEVTKTYTYALAVRKVDKEANGQTVKGLANAYFTVASSLAPQVPLNFMDVEGSEGVYKFVAAGTDGAVTEVVSPSGDGIIIIKGVKGSLEEGGTFKYILTETKAPAGYNKLTSTIEVPVQKDTTYEKKVITYFKDAEKKEVTDTVTKVTEEKNTLWEVSDVVVINNKGVLLPSTGGMGTTIFYIIGGILVIGAGVLLITKKRMSTK